MVIMKNSKKKFRQNTYPYRPVDAICVSNEKVSEDEARVTAKHTHTQTYIQYTRLPIKTVANQQFSKTESEIIITISINLYKTKVENHQFP